MNVTSIKKKSWLSLGPLAGLRCTSIPEIQGLRITSNQGSRVTFPVRTHRRGESQRGESQRRKQMFRPRTTFLAQQDPDLCVSLTRLMRWIGFHNFLCYGCLPPQLLFILLLPYNSVFHSCLVTPPPNSVTFPVSEMPGSVQRNIGLPMLWLPFALWGPPENVCECNALFSHVWTHLLLPLGFLPARGSTLVI